MSATSETELQLVVQAYERAVQRWREVNRDMAAILDHVAQGLVSVTVQGHPTDVSSRTLEQWFGPITHEIPIWDYLFPHDLERATWTRLGFESLALDVIPAEIVIAQLTTVFEHAGRSLRVRYVPTVPPIESLLVVVTDITDELRRAELDRLHGEVLALVERERIDPVGVIELLATVDELARRIVRADVSTMELLGDVHTLKGITSLFGLASVAEACEAAETEAADDGDRPSARALARVTRAWETVRHRSRPFLERDGHDAVRVSRAEYEAALAATAPHECALAARIRSWGTTPIQPQLEQLADHIQELARRLGKPIPHVHIIGGDVRVERARIGPLWLALAHAVRNIVAHAIEPEDRRIECGKPARTQVTVTARVTSRALQIELRDDGRGIDWARIDRRAQAMGAPPGREAVFTAGVSTRDRSEITEEAGRGIGMGAIRTTCERLGGSVVLESEPGIGTVLCCEIPHGEGSCHGS